MCDMWCPFIQNAPVNDAATSFSFQDDNDDV